MKTDEKVSGHVLCGSCDQPAGGAVALYRAVDVWLPFPKSRRKRKAFLPENAAALLDYLKCVGGETDNLSFGPEGVPLDVEAETQYLAAQVASKDNVQYLAWADGQIIGDASLNRKPRRMSHRGEFGISVRKAYWGCGVSSALMEAVLAFAVENGFEQINLEVRSDNLRAIRLYEKFGFRKLCTFPAFFKLNGQYIDFDLMNRDMR